MGVGRGEEKNERSSSSSSSGAPAAEEAAGASRSRPRAPLPAGFARKKDRVLRGLAAPEAEYADASPKGSVDAGVRDLIAHLNAVPGLVTTSSCAGRVCVFVEGRRRDREGEGEAEAERKPLLLEKKKKKTLAGVGGKGGGGAWLFVSHDPVPLDGKSDADLDVLLGLGAQDRGGARDASGSDDDAPEARLVHFKFEPMVSYFSRVFPRYPTLFVYSCARN